MIDLQLFGFEDKKFARRFGKLDCDGGGDGGGGGDGTIGGFGGEFGGDVSGGSGSGGSGGNVGGAGSAGPSGEAGQLSSNPADMGQHNAAPAPAPSSGGSPDSSVAAAVANYGQQSITPTTTEGFFSSLVSHFTNEPINMAKSMMNMMSPIPMAFSLAEVTSQTLDAMVGFLGGQPDATAAGAGAGSQGGPVGPEQVKQALVNMGYQYNPSTGSYINPSPVVQAQAKYQNTLTAFNQASINSAIQRILDVDTDIEYNKTLADLSGIQMDAKEKALLDAQKNIAIDRALTTIEDTFSQEGESMVAQQIQNLGTNALGGTIGQGFIKRWQEREAAAKTGALQDIESTYLAAERQAIDQQKQRQIDMWDKDYDAEVKTAELSLDKAKAESLLQYEWDRSYLQDATTRRGQDITAEQANLDRLLNERMGNVSIGAYEDANKWSAVAGVGGAIAGGIAKSDWFGDTLKSWLD
jgi:hypothetical protein